MGNFSKSFCSKSPFKKEEPTEEKEKKGVSINDKHIEVIFKLIK